MIHANEAKKLSCATEDALRSAASFKVQAIYLPEIEKLILNATTTENRFVTYLPLDKLSRITCDELQNALDKLGYRTDKIVSFGQPSGVVVSW